MHTYEDYVLIRRALNRSYRDCVVRILYPYGPIAEHENSIEISGLRLVEPDEHYPPPGWEQQIDECCLRVSETILREGISFNWDKADLKCTFCIHMTVGVVEYMFTHLSVSKVLRIADNSEWESIAFSTAGVPPRSLLRFLVGNMTNYRPVGVQVVEISFASTSPLSMQISTPRVESMGGIGGGYRYANVDSVNQNLATYEQLAEKVNAAYSILDPPGCDWDTCSQVISLAFEQGISSYRRTYAKRHDRTVRSGLISVDEFFLMGVDHR